MPESLFSSQQSLRNAFIAGLRRLLEQPGLGVYILTHANASFDEEIFQELEPQLKERFRQLAESCRDTLGNGREMVGAPDDQTVFLKLMAIGFEGVHLAEFRQEGDWELQFNHIRAFRPARIADTKVQGVYRPFSQSGFHFNKPFLRKEVFWAGELQGLEVELLYNKFPFTPLHGLLVPERRSREPQFLSHLYHLYIWRLTESMAEGLPEVGFSYNSYGAFASVNHLHFQMFMRTEPLPLMAGDWRHNGGEVDYPVPCEVYTSVTQAWERLDELHRSEISFNLIYLPGRLYCLPRRSQGSYKHAPWTNGFAWYELAGGITTFSRSDFETLDATAIRDEMAKLRLPES
jgi:diadenosine tetraphosphate (Ap4A) HIT family hydrolase